MREKFNLKLFLREHRRDALLLLSLILFIVILTLVLALTRGTGDTVKVEIDGTEVARYPLSQDGEYKLGGGNTLVIENGKAYMKDADCPDRTCVRSGSISHKGESIICLPNRVAVSVVTNSQDGPDIVS